ncbi:MAG: alpha/beta hydrolase fold domain-containing protein [Polyangia bacterium]
MRRDLGLALICFLIGGCGGPAPSPSEPGEEFGLAGCAPGYDVTVGDVRLASSGGCNLPALLHIHGGGWSSGSAADMDAYREVELANHLVYVSIDYPLFPASMETMLASVQIAINFLRTQHLLLGIDPDRIGLVGESAGGQLALEAGIRDGDLRFIGSLYGPPDMRAEETNFCQTFGALAPGQELCAVIHEIEGGTPAEVPQNYDADSPIVSLPGLAAHQQAPHFYFGESIGDLLVPVQTVDAFTAALSAHGLPVVNDRIPGDPGVIGHNLGPDKNNYLRARAVLNAIAAMNAAALPPPSFAPPAPPSPAGAPPPPAPAPPPSCTCACSGQVGLASSSSSATASTCAAAEGAAVPVVQNALFTDVLIAGPPWTLLYTEAIGIPVTCQCN